MIKIHASVVVCNRDIDKKLRGRSNASKAEMLFSVKVNRVFFHRPIGDKRMLKKKEKWRVAIIILVLLVVI